MASSNSVQILINAKDNASSALSRVSDEVDRFGNTSHASIDKASTSWLGMGTVIGAVSGIVSNVASRAINTLTDSIDSAVKRVDTLNNSSKVFQNLGFRADDVTASMSELKNSILGLPTSLDQAVQGMQSLALQSGDIRLARKEFTAMNDAVLASGHSTADLDNAIQQITQLDMDGPLDAQTWNSLKQSGLEPALSAMAKMSGVTMADLKTQFGDGTLKVRDFMERLQELDTKGTGNMASLSKQAKDMTGGIGTGMENAKTAITRGVADIINAIGSERISGSITKIGQQLESVLKTVAEKLPGILKKLSEFASFLDKHRAIIAIVAGAIAGPLVLAFGAWTIAAAQAAVATIAATWPVLAIGAAVGLVAYLIVSHWTAIKRAFVTVWDWVKSNWPTLAAILAGPLGIAYLLIKHNIDRINVMFSAAWSFIKTVWGAVASFFKGIWDDVAHAADIAWRAIYNNTIKPVVDLITAYIRGVGAVASYVWDWVKALTVLAWHWIYDNAVKPVIDAISIALNWIASTASTVWNAISLAASTAWNWLYSNVVQPVVNAIVVAVNWMGGVISTVWDWIKNTASTAWNWVGNQASTAWNWVVGVWQSAVGWFAGVWNSISGAAVAPANSIKSTFSGVMEGVKDVVRSAVNWIIDRINGMIGAVNKIADKVPGAPKLGTLPRFALGTNFAPGGMALVGENGPEVVNLPRGSQVTPNYALGGAMQQAAPSVTNNIYGNITLGDAGAVNTFFDRLDRSGQLAAKGLAS